MEFVGFFNENQKELLSVGLTGVKSDFFANYAFIFNNIRKTQLKMLENSDPINQLKGFHFSLKTQSINVRKVEDIIVVVGFKEHMNNLPFIEQFLS